MNTHHLNTSSSNLLPGSTASLGSGSLTPSPLATQYPHLSHYIASLLQIALQENLQAQANAKENGNAQDAPASGASSAATTGGVVKSTKHPLSVSSASSDVHDEDNNGDLNEKEEMDGVARSTTSSSSPPSVGVSASEDEGEPKLRLEIPMTVHQPLSSHSQSPVVGVAHVPSAQREELIRKVIDLLGNEKEEEVKGVVKERLGVLGNVSQV